MNPQSRIWWGVVVLGAILAGPVAVGADDDDDAAADHAVVQQEATIVHLIFQESQGKNKAREGSIAAAGRARVESQLKAMLDDLVQACQLSETEQQQLALAGRGDIKRFFDQVERIHKKYHGVNFDQNQFAQVRQEIIPLQQQLSRGLFRDGSLFAKTLHKTLTAEQEASYQALLFDRRRTGYRAAIETSLARLGNGIVLRGEQQESLQELLLETTQPPLVFGPYDQHVVMLRLSQLPPEKLRKVLDRGQWKQLQPQLEQASGTEGILGQRGIIEEPDPNAPVILRSVRAVVDGPAPASAPADAVKRE